MIRSFLKGYIRVVRSVLPTPFTIAIILTLFTLLSVILYKWESGEGIDLVSIAGQWNQGLWKSNLIVFAFQMMLMLVLGHVLAITPAVNRLISSAVKLCNTSARATLFVALSTLIVGLFNWGLGLIFGAIFARKVGEHAARNGISINYPLVGAAGYAAMMIWHCGLSGSSLIKVAEEGHLQALIDSSSGIEVPSMIGLDLTVFSALNLSVILGILVTIPATLYAIAKLTSSEIPTLKFHSEVDHTEGDSIGAERLDRSQIFSVSIGSLILLYVIYLIMTNEKGVLGFFNPDNINLLLFGLCLALHKNILKFLHALDDAIKGASGILIQFPLYFGILGLMNASGLINEISSFFINISNQGTYPLLTFISAGIVNIFVPSGGGQWAIQGPIILQSSAALGIPFEKSILALAYGDQITNMLQPFWALPLLGITKLKAQDILPYTLVMFLVGSLVYGAGLLLF